MWIKICGLMTEAAVRTVVDAGADAVGFVFAPSKRQVDASTAKRIAVDVPSHVMRVAVMQHPTQTFVDDVLAVFKPHVLQTDYADLSLLQLPESLQRLPVMRAGMPLPESLPARLLFEGPVSGTGQTADWRSASAIAQRVELILAGGLNDLNVANAIATVRPFGVDVSSGVESAPGVKDLKKD